MDLLMPHLSKIKVPSPYDKVYKDECMFSFDNPETDTGLYVSLTSFYGFGRDYVENHCKRTGNAVYLHVFKERIEVSSSPQGDGPEKKITRLAIGVEGGFDPDSGRKKYEFIDHFYIVVLPDFVRIPWPNQDVPEIVRMSVSAILEAQSASKVAEMASMTGTWDGEARIISKHCENLVQLNNGVKIPPSGWQCVNCDKTDNLWLNLTDGGIHCGRKFFDGTGGNGHAVEHYSATGYPLAVKLGTITKEGKGDVFSYTEDDLVEDPKLIEHLAHWGINITNVEKTEKSMVELELELNQKTSEWAALQESEGQLTPMYGPGYTGMTNLGNSCYMNSVMQMLFIIPEFQEKYISNAQAVFEACEGDPADDFNVQMAKLGCGLTSGKYSVPPPVGSPVDADPPGILPLMFKTCLGKGHKEFSTKNQQDVQEFFLHILELMEKNGATRTGKIGRNAGSVFDFKLEDRVQCNTSKKVKYIIREDHLLTLKVPMEAVINKEEVAAYEARKIEVESQGRKLLADTLVRPRLRLSSLLESFSQTEIARYHSAAINDYTTAKQTTRFETFPKYLLVHLSKYTVRDDWVPIKLDIAVEMADELDLNMYKACGLQPGEEQLPNNSENPPEPDLNPGLISALVEMGFPIEACKKAVFFTKNIGIEPATQWVMEHITDVDFSDPFVPPGLEKDSSKSSKNRTLLELLSTLLVSSKKLILLGYGTYSIRVISDIIAIELHLQANSELTEALVSMGFSSKKALAALKAGENDLQRAMDWLETHLEEPEDIAADMSMEEDGEQDGNCHESKDGRYKLIAFVSHMGTSVHVGHYVVHILKEGRWVIFNDNKIAQSANPPKDLGYLYLYQRV